MNSTPKKVLRRAQFASTPDELEKSIVDSHQYLDKEIVNGNCPAGELDISIAYKNSLFLLKEYATLDWQHCNEIAKVMDEIRRYARDPSRKRPLNIILHAESGSGKSHFVECLARAMSEDQVGEVTFNMSSMRGIEDLMQPLDAVRNLKVRDKLPLLFLDEFDTDDTKYALLLPLLWDGKLSTGERVLRTGKTVIILAGSKSDIGNAIQSAKSMKANLDADGKMIDLVSRINGGELAIPSLDTSRRTADKICVAISLLRERFGRRLTRVPWALLKFMAITRFRHGVRSISNLIESIANAELSKRGALECIALKLPLDDLSDFGVSNLPMHIVAEDGAQSVVDCWQQCKQCTSLVKIAESDNAWNRLLEFSAGERARGKKI